MGEILFHIGTFLIGIIIAKILIKWMESPIEHFGKSEERRPNPFIASEYLERIEKAGLEILEQQKPIERIIILWWGLDGLRLNEDGTLQWISRKKQEPVNQNVFYQPMQWVAPLDYGFPHMANMCQSTQSQIDYLRAQNTFFQLQAAQMAQNAQITNGINALNSQCCPQDVLFY